MFCKKCGITINNNATVCKKCEKNLKKFFNDEISNDLILNIENEIVIPIDNNNFDNKPIEKTSSSTLNNFLITMSCVIILLVGIIIILQAFFADIKLSIDPSIQKDYGDMSEFNLDIEEELYMLNGNNGYIYQLIVSDVSWDVAFAMSSVKGGHLVKLDSTNEVELVIKLLSTHDTVQYVYTCGSRDNGEDYVWHNNPNNIVVDLEKYNDYWYPNEPSFIDADTGKVENSLQFFKSKNKWYLVDNEKDLTSIQGGTLMGKGKIGYVVKFNSSRYDDLNALSY